MESQTNVSPPVVTPSDVPSGELQHDTTPETGEVRQPSVDHSSIPGWGLDRDPHNRPAVPMEHKPPRLQGVHWKIPEQQPVRVKIYHSIERPNITPVFGTSTPPVGLSGKIRDVAYQLTENDIRHWLLLMLADRVNMVEGIADDLRKGRVPNVFAEVGGRAMLRHAPGMLVRAAVIGSATVGLGYYLIKRRSSRLSKRHWYRL